MGRENISEEQVTAERSERHCRSNDSDKPGTRNPQTQKGLQEQLHFLQTLIDSIPSPIFYKDIDNLYLGCNKAFEKRLGLVKEEIIGKSAYELFPSEMAEKYHNMDLALLRQPGEQAYEDTLLYADGRLRHVIIRKSTFTNADGALAGLLGVTVDITDRKQAEEELRKAHDELELRVEKRTAQLAKANEELRNEIAERKRIEEALEESTEKLKRFAYSVMHDLKSPTVGINGLTRLLQRQYEDRLDERGKKYCTQILRASEYLAKLVEKINAYIAAKETPLKMETFNVGEIFQILRDEFLSLSEERHIRWVEPERTPEIRADQLSLLRVFRNFVDNALKYGGDLLTEIRIGYQESEAFHIFSVSDDGVGIRKEHSEKIFGPFQRNETSKKIEGAGLGLAIVRETAERHHGQVWMEPGIEKGITFYISIAKDL